MRFLGQKREKYFAEEKTAANPIQNNSRIPVGRMRTT
jgi:hypothetical protein